MTANIILGWFLIIAGSFFILLGTVNATIDTYKRLTTLSAGVDVIALIAILIEFIRVISITPRYLALTLVGIFLVMLGFYMVGAYLWIQIQIDTLKIVLKSVLMPETPGK